MRERESELETNYMRLREVEGARLLAEERARIMRDMHDGVGGVLVSTLAMVEMGQTTREGIQEVIQNVLKHARARTVFVSTGTAHYPTIGDGLYMCVTYTLFQFSSTVFFKNTALRRYNNLTT